MIKFQLIPIPNLFHLSFFILIISLMHVIESKIMLNSWGNYNYATFQCIRSRGYDTIILKLDSRQNYINRVDVDNIVNAKNAGFQVQPALTPCRVKSPALQAQRIIKSFNTAKITNIFTKIWAVPMDNDPICTWTIHDPVSNCQYLQQFIKQMQKYNISTGIAADRDSWMLSFGSLRECPEVSWTLLWWLPVDEQDDNQPNFNSYHQIGGWRTPYMKQYTSWTVCGINTDLNYYNN